MEYTVLVDKVTSQIIVKHAQNKKPLKAVWPDREALTFDLETWNLQGQGHKGPNGNNL